MNVYFFHHDVYEKRYNCNQLSMDEWRAQGEPHPYMGVFLIIMGLMLQAVYLPFIITMLQPKFISTSCYKLMFFLGIMDFIQISGASLVTGYLTMQGAVFCTHPNMSYIFGIIGLGAWCGSCVTCMILTINRCIDVYFPQLSRVLFHGWRTWLWTIIPLSIVGWIIAFENTLCFNSRYLAWFFDPYFGMNSSLRQTENGLPIVYASQLHTINNVSTVAILCTGNIVLCYYVFSASSSTAGSNSAKLKKQLVIQVCVISILETFCSFIYAYMQFFYTPIWLIVAGSITYQVNCGMMALTYLFLNPTLRRAAFNLFSKCAKAAKISDMTASLFKTQESRNTNRTNTDA
ncbi:serpentine type 7TM GPCR chemoreceptor srt domain-containing protein [Ditylenchus destructor]|uniref:Serpentine type 7TM GPCR chemoreceptor srt domain-containing protein n=1 Tax=Ditylenchus destructor TaxID=166010 RepID=A0AAD4N2N1_9BILA|nr:serpentine type 7TM GPCR chemoreceptor srt domain-containing protein [Ditylenchus destructor]